VDQHADHLDEKGHRLVVRNDHDRRQTIQTNLGPVVVKTPRVEDLRIVGQTERGESLDPDGRPVNRFHSKILPPYLLRTKSIKELVPWLYLNGISNGDFHEALSALPGKDAPGWRPRW